MASIKDVSKSLINAVSEVVTKSSEHRAKLERAVFVEALKKFKVSSVSELAEQDKKAFHAYVQNQLTESDCSCGSMDEDDMPGDEVYHKGGDEDAEKKKELGEDEDEEDSSVDASDSEEKDDIEERCWDGYKPTPGVKAYEKGSCMKEGADPDELATNGALGVTDASKQLPVHADVLKDSSPVDGTTEYRLFAQFNTNTLPQIVPPVTLPGAPTVDALRDIVEGLPWFCDVCERALADASDSPHQRVADETTEVNESYIATPYDKKVMATIKNTVKAHEVTVSDTLTKGLHVHKFTAVVDKPELAPEIQIIHVSEEPSRKAPGKSVWRVQSDINGYGIESLVSEPYLPGVELKALQALKDVLAKVFLQNK
jgi:hypothetical protein